MKYAFIKAHRVQFNVRAMCRMLCVHPSGFYAWLQRPFSSHANEDIRQTIMLKDAWHDSGKVYGYRKLHDDLRDHGETCCPNRVRDWPSWQVSRLRLVISAAPVNMVANPLSS